MNPVSVLSVASAVLPFDPAGKPLLDVVRAVERALAGTEIEPEWIVAANMTGDEDEALYGLAPSDPWPSVRAHRRVTLSVERGQSEGWIVQVDRVRRVANSRGNAHWQSQPLMRIKALARAQAWSVAAAVSRLLDID